jgi:hypothetical protein
MLSLVAPVLLAAATLRRSRKQVAALILLVGASGLILVITSVLTTLPVVRYLHPLGWMISAAFLPAILGALSADRSRQRNGAELAVASEAQDRGAR